MAKAVNRSRLRWRLFWLGLCSFFITLLPVVAVFFVNLERYTETPADTFKLCLGGIVVLIFVVLKVLGKLQVPRRVVVYAVIFVLAFLLEAVLADLILISGAALLGEALDVIVFQRAIRATRERLTVEKTSDATADKVEALFQTYIGGRV